MTNSITVAQAAAMMVRLGLSRRSLAIVGSSMLTLVASIACIATPPLAAVAAEPEPATIPACADCTWSIANLDSLLAEIATARDEGLDPLAYNSAGLRVLASDGVQSHALDRAADSAALMLARHYLLGRVDDHSRQSWYIARTDDNTAALAAGLQLALARGQLRPWFRGLLPTDRRYTALRAAYIALPDSDKEARSRVRVNLERWRWMPRDLGARHIFVNVPGYTLDVVDNGAPVSSYDVVVGAPATPTPQIAASAQTVVVNPSWHVPTSIIRSSNLHAGKAGFITTALPNGGLAFSQPPGPHNALGRIKVDMPNPDAIYLHDTPSKSLFQKTSRAFSHGCIRVKDIDRLASELVARDAGDPHRISRALAGYETTPVRLRTARPVFIVYFTVEVDGTGKLVRHDDPYGRDTRLGMTLAKLDLATRARTALVSTAPRAKPLA